MDLSQLLDPGSYTESQIFLIFHSNNYSIVEHITSRTSANG
jgi:hypothetical protein